MLSFTEYWQVVISNEVIQKLPCTGLSNGDMLRECDFRELKNRILKRQNIDISLSTLKRVMKDKTHNFLTKDKRALETHTSIVKAIGYKGWEQFIEKNILVEVSKFKGKFRKLTPYAVKVATVIHAFKKAEFACMKKLPVYDINEVNEFFWDENDYELQLLRFSLDVKSRLELKLDAQASHFSIKVEEMNFVYSYLAVAKVSEKWELVWRHNESLVPYEKTSQVITKKYYLYCKREKWFILSDIFDSFPNALQELSD